MSSCICPPQRVCWEEVAPHCHCPNNVGFSSVALRAQLWLLGLCILALQTGKRWCFCLARVIFALGISMTFINIPVEWFSIGFDWTWMLLFGDIRQGIFYAMLLSFWIIFCGEHMMVGTTRKGRLCPAPLAEIPGNSLVESWKQCCGDPHPVRGLQANLLLLFLLLPPLDPLIRTRMSGIVSRGTGSRLDP